MVINDSEEAAVTSSARSQDTTDAEVSRLEQLEAEIVEAELHLAQLRRELADRVEHRAGSTRIPLYDWQRDALIAWDDADRCGVVQAVTGAGKTRVGLAAIEDAHRLHRKSLVLVPTLALVRQWTAALAELLPDVRVRRGHGSDGWDVIVTTVQSAMRRPALIPPGGLVVADECHRYGADSYSLALNRRYQWRLGLTATLERGDEGDGILSSYFGGVCFDLDYERATTDGLVAPFKIAFASVPLNADERSEYDTLDAELNAARLPLIDRYDVPAQPVAAFLKGVSALAEDRTPGGGGGLARLYMARFSRRKALLAETSMKYLALQGLARAVHTSAGSIVFTQTKESARGVARVLAASGCAAAAVHSDLDSDEREERLEMLKDGRILALSAPRILDEGIDVPDADLGIVMASNRSRRQMIQRLGRVLRQRPEKVARFVVLYAEGSVEDPRAAGHLPDFYDACLPWARAHEWFDLGAGELPALLTFLGASPDNEANRVTRELQSAAAPIGQPAVGTPGGPPGADTDEDSEPLPILRHLTRQEAASGWGPSDARFSAPPPSAFWSVSQDSIRDYLLAIGRCPLLRSEEEVYLARAIEAGLYAAHLLGQDASREATLAEVVTLGESAQHWMVVSNLRLVVSIAKKYTGQGLDFLDLIQAGNLGLIHAVEKFDYQQGTKFSTYATWWITQAVTRTLADEGRAIRLPVHFVEKLKQVEAWRRGTSQTWTELFNDFPNGLPAHGVTREELVRMVKLARPLISTDWLTEQADDAWVAKHVTRTEESLADDVVERLTPRRGDGILERLDAEFPVGAFVLRCRHGFQTGEPETLEVIGLRRGVTRERIRQIEQKAVQLARTYADDLEGMPALVPPAGPVPRRDTPMPNRSSSQPVMWSATPPRRAAGPAPRGREPRAYHPRRAL